MNERILSSDLSRERPNNIVVLDVNQLIERSPTFLVLDGEILNKMRGKKFNPKRYARALPEVIRIGDPNNTDGEGFRYEMLNGHHRLVSALSYKVLHPDYVIEVHDSTDDVLSGYPVQSDIDGTEDRLTRRPDQEHLTEAQHFAECTDPERAHQELASPRVAAQLLTKWPRIVGDELAEEYTALAAYLRIGCAFLSPRNATGVSKFLQERDPQEHDNPAGRKRRFFVGETDERREKIEKALIGMAESMDKRNVAYSDVLKDLFAFTRERLGEKDVQDVRDQVRGFLAFPEVNEKIVTTATDEQVVLDRRVQLGEVLTAVVLEDIETTRDIQALYTTLIDTDITYAQMLTILHPPQVVDGKKKETIRKRYDAMKKKIAVEALTVAYTEVRGDTVNVLAPVEVTLLDKLAEADTPNRLVGPLAEAVTVFAEAAVVPVGDEALDAARAALQGASTRNKLIKRTEELRELLDGREDATPASTELAADLPATTVFESQSKFNLEEITAFVRGLSKPLSAGDRESLEGLHALIKECLAEREPVSVAAMVEPTSETGTIFTERPNLEAVANLINTHAIELFGDQLVSRVLDLAQNNQGQRGIQLIKKNYARRLNSLGRIFNAAKDDPRIKYLNGCFYLRVIDEHISGREVDLKRMKTDMLVQLASFAGQEESLDENTQGIIQVAATLTGKEYNNFTLSVSVRGRSYSDELGKKANSPGVAEHVERIYSMPQEKMEVTKPEVRDVGYDRERDGTPGWFSGIDISDEADMMKVNAMISESIHGMNLGSFEELVASIPSEFVAVSLTNFAAKLAVFAKTCEWGRAAPQFQFLGRMFARRLLQVYAPDETGKIAAIATSLANYRKNTFSDKDQRYAALLEFLAYIDPDDPDYAHAYNHNLNSPFEDNLTKVKRFTGDAPWLIAKRDMEPVRKAEAFKHTQYHENLLLEHFKFDVLGLASREVPESIE
ncbi:MAG: hypothetical protein AAB553_06200 [Patescibacteria group bacterium]